MRVPKKPKLPIEKDVPISEHYMALHRKMQERMLGGRPAKHNYPLDDMEVGDSFLIPITARVGDVRRLANVHGEKVGKAFLTLRDDKHQYRVYRTA